MSDGNEFSIKSGEPRKTLFGVKARLCFRIPKTTLPHTPKGRMEGKFAPDGCRFLSSTTIEKTQKLMNKPYRNFERTRPISRPFMLFSLIYVKTFTFLQQTCYICTRNAYK